MTHHKPPNQVKVPSNQQYHPITANPWINPNNLNVNEQNKNTPKSQRGPFLRPPEPTAMDDMAIDKTRMKKMDDPYVLDSDLKDIIHELFPDERKKSDSPGDGADYINNIVNDPYGDDEIFIHDSMPSVFSTQNSFENYGQTQQDSTCIAHTHAQGDLMRNNQGMKRSKQQQAHYNQPFENRMLHQKNSTNSEFGHWKSHISAFEFSMESFTR